MAGTSALRRLLQVLEIEEEQAKIVLESVLAEHRLLERRLSAAIEQQRGGRRLLVASARSGNLTDRWAALEEARFAVRRAEQLKPRIKEAEVLVSMRRQEYLNKRVERRQAETLIVEAEASEALKSGRRSQQALDDWYLNRLHRDKHAIAGQAVSVRAASGKRDRFATEQDAESVATES